MIPKSLSHTGVHLFQGITYDTGGADIKVGGCMAGMHRDKCGSAFVAGFFEVNLYCYCELVPDSALLVSLRSV